MYKTQKKIAIVYDWIDKWGGVERLLLHLHDLFPQAPFFTSAVSLQNAQWARSLSITPSFLQSLPLGMRTQRFLLAPLFPLAFESFQFGDYDLVISVTSAFAKGIITQPGTTHICYLLTPPRYLWSHTNDYLSGVKGFLGNPFFRHLKNWDRVAAARPDGYISISNTTSQRAGEYYAVDSSVVYPPFDTHYWDSQKKVMNKPHERVIPQEYYLWVGRMENYKRPDVIVEAARKKQESTFVFVGTGSLYKSLMDSAPKNCIFMGTIPDNELAYLYTHAKALIMPQNEDFGYVSLEAQYHGCPVIAYQAGGACETVLDGITGIFMSEQSASSLLSELARFEQISYNLIHSTALMQKKIEERFGIERFDKQFIYQLNRYIHL